MPRAKYREHLQMIECLQYNGDNLAELEEFAPGLIVVEGGQVYCKHENADIRFPVNATDWLIDDPANGYVAVITDLAWQCRFNPTPQ
jgi:hypothetical protein